MTEIPLPGLAFESVIGAGSIWIFTQQDGTGPGASPSDSIVRADPRTNEIVATIPAEGSLAFGEGALWALCCHTGEERAVTLQRIDPATDRVVATIGLPAGASAQAAGAPAMSGSRTPTKAL